MVLTYRIWDKTSPINGCEADTAIEALNISITDEVYIISNETGADWILQTQQNAPYRGATIEESAQNHINQLIADEEAVKNRASQPTEMELLKAESERQAAALIDLMNIVMGG